MNNLLVLLTAPTNALNNGLGVFLLPLVLIVLMYFFMIRPQKKQEKKLQELRNNMQVGDRIVTIGGVLGKVVNIKDNEVTISTSVAGTMLTFRKDAISQVMKPTEEKSE